MTMLCQDTAGELPAVHISKEAFEVAQRYERYHKLALLEQLAEWVVTFKSQYTHLLSVKFEFTDFLQKKKQC